jgi:hypothetical protein
MKLVRKSSEKGFAHLAALLLVVVVLASVGTYVLVKGHAQTTGSTGSSSFKYQGLSTLNGVATSACRYKGNLWLKYARTQTNDYYPLLNVYVVDAYGRNPSFPGQWYNQTAKGTYYHYVSISAYPTSYSVGGGAAHALQDSTSNPKHVKISDIRRCT